MAVPKSVVHLTFAEGIDATARFHIERRRESSFGRRFLIVFDDDWGKVLAGVKNPTALHLANTLPKLLSPSSYSRVDQAVLAEQQRVSQSAISRAMTILVQRGFLEKTGKGPGVRYRLSPLVAWRGTTAAYHAQQHREDRDYGREAQNLALHVQLNLALPPAAPPPKKGKT